jgi:hypothetical protein
LADWRIGGLADWRIGGLADWRIGGLADWRMFRVPDSQTVSNAWTNLLTYQFTPESAAVNGKNQKTYGTQPT